MHIINKVKLFSKNLIHIFIQVLLPQSCIVCGVYSFDLSFCKKCFDNIPKPKNIGVPWIHSTITYDHQSSHKIIHTLKYYNKKSIANSLAYYSCQDFSNFIDTYIGYNNLKNIFQIFFIPIPISEERYMTRGYNQSQLLAISLSSFLTKNKSFKKNIKVVETLIYKDKNTTKLSQLHDVSFRQEEMYQSMHCDKEEYKNILEKNENENLLEKNENLLIDDESILTEKSNKNILYVLIDDITTTGSTLYEARRALMTLPDMDQKYIVAWTVGH